MKVYEKLNIAVAGTGYVGLSIATLLSQRHHVTAVDRLTLSIIANHPFKMTTLKNILRKKTLT